MVLRRFTQQYKSVYSFCKVESYTIKPQNTVIDYKTLTYNPQQKIKFDSSNKSLLYYYKPLVIIISLYHTALDLSIIILGVFIPHGISWKCDQAQSLQDLNIQMLVYSTFPAALPMMFTVEFWLFLRWFKKFKYLRYVVSEVYLHKDGQTVEVVFEKKFWRKVKEQNVTQIFYVTNLKTLSGDDKRPLKGNLFPDQWPQKKELFKQWRWSFVKYYLNQNNFLVFPSNPNYVNAEILIAVMNGKIINTSKQYVEDVEGDMVELVEEGKIKSDTLI
ncbi:unnamed protein product (macronuclear) [Paramecium tetraurelia]|uniref:Uncharacterized protein n=1 Tax=Paramecium tetraurelia TaxID=5888 RepID=A0BSG5_PARTE|nr:uncharacterized protein GSPATT00031714001 [Paramecium tetraurelia]CAK61482.1 unnamed protein product [Paramecium tetraurelia]|eukprot:XP_001428880.1 hypothetical protein (macronuclear) [Paramecium tetraurelia strain d4-2]